MELSGRRLDVQQGASKASAINSTIWPGVREEGEEEGEVTMVMVVVEVEVEGGGEVGVDGEVNKIRS